MASAARFDRYRRVAGVYDRIVEPVLSGYRDAGMGLAPPRPDARVLDVGCGTGSHLERYSRSGCRVAGVDTSIAMLTEARRRLGSRALLLAADAEALPFAESVFDLVLAVAVLHELPVVARARVLREMVRVMTGDGRLLAIDHHPSGAGGWRSLGRRTLTHLVEMSVGREHHSGFRSFVRSGGFPALVGPVGLRIESFEPAGAGSLGVYLARKE
jgi:demethylmenaquinone methyltransferase/2-methoxy-6-polyprenyl-1,4-benzoquinol methylase